jgi:hypothetical protein
MHDDLQDSNLLTCGECGSIYRYTTNGRMRGPGSFDCRTCGQDIFIWDAPESLDYDFELIEVGTWQNDSGGPDD